MTNTYAINTTRKKEFEVADDLRALGLHPWVPIRRAGCYVKEKRAFVYYDAPYISKLVFCVIPPIYWLDVLGIKHVIGKPLALSRMDIQGTPEHAKQSTGEIVPPRYGLNQFRAAVEAEYADAQRHEANSSYQCQYSPGQALELLSGPFEGFRAEFDKVIRRAHDDYAKLRLSVEMFGQVSTVEVDPDHVRAVS